MRSSVDKKLQPRVVMWLQVRQYNKGFFVY
mgnify:CR=1 FL=1